MSLGVEHLRAVFADTNVRAFYMVVRKGESSLDDRAYRMINGGGTFDDFSRHPFDGLATRQGGRAAGAPQFIPSTWSEIAAKWGLEDFSPDSQDLGYVACLEKRHAVDLIRQGEFEAAVAACRLEWTSLPGASENHAAWNMDAARALYLDYGGRLDNAELLQPEAPIEDRPQPQAEPLEEPTMPIPAIILGLLEAASAVLPVIASIRADKSQPAAAKNLAVASKVLDVVKDSVGAVNQQQAVEMVTTDPAARAKADEALKAQYFDLMKYAAEQESVAWDRAEKSTAEARGFAERMTSGEGWRAIGYGALIGVLALLIIGGSGVLFSFVLFSPKELFDGSVRAGIIEIIKAIVILVVGFFFGSSSASRQSGEALRNIAQGKGVQP